MFGAKYSRMKFWIISICLLIPALIVHAFARSREEVGNFDAALFLYSVGFLLALIWINTLANRMRDHGANPWFSLFSLIPFVNIILALYYGIVRYGNINSFKSENNTGDPSLAKAVYNHSKDVVSDINPAINDYKERHAAPKPNQSDSIAPIQSSISVESTEDEIYEKIMLEIEEDKKVKSSWARALSQSAGDKDKAESIYINLRVEKLNSDIEKLNLDPLYFDAKNFVLTEVEISSYYLPVVIFLSKKFKIKQGRAKIIAEQLEKNGILSAPNMSGNHKVYN